MTAPLDDTVLDRLFRAARTHSAWRDEPVSDDLLRRIYDLARMGPTSANCSPMRVVFLRSPEAKRRLEPCLSKGNRAKTMAAPVTAIVAYDMQFHERLPALYPIADARSWFTGDEALVAATALRNGSLQGGYFILAARALGLDCGPMSGFDNGRVDAEFFAGTNWKSNFLCNLGHGDPAALRPRSPRLSFDEACILL